MLALEQIFRLRSRLVLVQWSLAPDKKFAQPPSVSYTNPLSDGGDLGERRLGSSVLSLDLQQKRRIFLIKEGCFLAD